MNTNRLKSCAYTILDNAQAIMMECNRDMPYGGYLLEKIKIIEAKLATPILAIQLTPLDEIATRRKIQKQSINF